MIQLERKIYGLVGFPVKHSLSPVMHNAAFAALKINAEYRLFELKQDELNSFFMVLPEKNICRGDRVARFRRPVGHRCGAIL